MSDPERIHRTCTCEAATLEALAAVVADFLPLPLYRYHSPMSGPWYSTIDHEVIIEQSLALRDGRRREPVDYRLPAIIIHLEYNDPEPSTLCPTIPGGLTVLLDISASAEDADRLIGQLIHVGVPLIDHAWSDTLPD
ncbi:MAG: hypothetical protein RLY71_3620 [Pseudomonadota bacterium]|jgi:hypothetical protein